MIWFRASGITQNFGILFHWSGFSFPKASRMIWMTLDKMGRIYEQIKWLAGHFGLRVCSILHSPNYQSFILLKKPSALSIKFNIPTNHSQPWSQQPYFSSFSTASRVLQQLKTTGDLSLLRPVLIPMLALCRLGAGREVSRTFSMKTGQNH